MSHPLLWGRCGPPRFLTPFWAGLAGWRWYRRFLASQSCMLLEVEHDTWAALVNEGLVCA